jgi:hypothetical protein
MFKVRVFEVVIKFSRVPHISIFARSVEARSRNVSKTICHCKGSK